MSLDKLKARIQALRARTVDNGCTEQEAIAAAAKVAELLDRHDLSLSDVEVAQSQCERAVFRTGRKKRMPIESCIGAIAKFCDCRVWREARTEGGIAFVFFGLPPDVTVAQYLAELIDNTVRAELGRYKTSAAYGKFRHADRALANSSFALGMVASMATKLTAMKEARDAANRSSGREIVLLKSTTVDSELAQLGLTLRQASGGRRMVSPDAFDAGTAAGAAASILAGIRAG
jgi:Protein of unknown function (DUF2786)